MSMTSEEEVTRGAAAKRLCEDPLFIEAMTKVEANTIQAWRSGDTPQKREAAHAKLKALEEIATQLRIVIQYGEVAEKKVETANRNRRPTLPKD